MTILKIYIIQLHFLKINDPEEMEFYNINRLAIGKIRRRGSTVIIATALGLEDQGVRVQVPVGSRIFTSPYHPDQVWGPPNLLSNGYQMLFPGVGGVART
jgi:hypothetical protein